MIVTALTRSMLKVRRRNRDLDYDRALKQAQTAVALQSHSTPATITKLPASWPFPVKS